MPAKKKVTAAATVPVPEPEQVLDHIPAPPPPYYDHLLRHIPERRNLGDRLYQVGGMFRVTSGATLDAEIELVWPEDAS